MTDDDPKRHESGRFEHRLVRLWGGRSELPSVPDWPTELRRIAGSRDMHRAMHDRRHYAPDPPPDPDDES